jgi:hypothetical protein
LPRAIAPDGAWSPDGSWFAYVGDIALSVCAVLSIRADYPDGDTRP